MSDVARSATFALDAAPADDEMVALIVEGRDVVVANVGGRLHAVDGVCTHEECPLSKGWLEGRSIVCECHGGTFDLVTGDPIDGPVFAPLLTHEVTRGDDTFTVTLSQRA